MGRNRRKTVLVHPRMQARIILATSLPMLACLVLAVVAELVYFRQIRLGVIESDGTIFGMPENRLGMLVLFVSAASCQVAAALLASQKVAGTAHRITAALDAFRRGDREARVHLRNADFQQDLAADVNTFLDWVDAGRDGAATPGAMDAPEKARPRDARAARRDRVRTD